MESDCSTCSVSPPARAVEQGTRGRHGVGPRVLNVMISSIRIQPEVPAVLVGQHAGFPKGGVAGTHYDITGTDITGPDITGTHVISFRIILQRASVALMHRVNDSSGRR